MEKYLGNKSSLLPLIGAFLQERIPKGRSLSDPFAGTANVSRYFRARGWDTAVCDANRFTYVLAQAYLGVTDLPMFLGVKTATEDTEGLMLLTRDFERNVGRVGSLYLPGQTAQEAFSVLAPLANVLRRLQHIGQSNTTPGPVSNHFTQWGQRSAFVSLRRTRGKRNYFSKSNALFLDGVLRSIREWVRRGTITRTESFLLLTSVLEEVVITANVNGTFHDFNRDRIWPNADQSFFLRVPLITCQNTTTELVNADAVSAAKSFAHHDVCYLDPPYNFRQYSAYYHFLNFIAAFPFLSDVESYLSEITHVRGQHPEDDFASDFCYRDQFVGALRCLIESTDSDHVVLSYYGGRNHWNHWSRVDVPTDEGLRELRAVFEDETLFKTSEVVPALDIRRNYQSRVGEQKGLVNEYLFHGVRRMKRKRPQQIPPIALPANERFGLSEAFCPTISKPVAPARLRAFG